MLMLMIINLVTAAATIITTAVFEGEKMSFPIAILQKMLFSRCKVA